MSDVFISHVSEDAAIALEIALGLESAGFSTWAYEVHSVPGPSYLIQTGEAVEKAQVVVLIISAHSLGSHQVTREVVRALESAKTFLPLLRDVSHVEFQTRQPEWRSAVGAATSIQIPETGVADIIPRIVSGLQALGVSASKSPDESRLTEIRAGLAHYTGGDSEPPATTPTPVTYTVEPASPVRRKLLLPVVLATLLIGAIAGSVFWLTRDAARSADTSSDPPAPGLEVIAPEILDITDLASKLIVLHDLAGHYVAVVPYWLKKDAAYVLFYGDEHTFHAQRVSGGGASGSESFNYTFWEPRVDARYKGSFDLRDEVYKIVCDVRETPLATADKSTTAAILSAATFTTPLWQHYAYALGRDEDGVYYYVDRAIDDEGGPRLFVGTKGNVEQKQLLDSTIDADGGVLTTDGARLSIGLEGGQVSQMRWSLDEVRVDLTPLDLWQNRSLIYAGLGAYGERLGTPCDDL